MRICLISKEYPPDTGWGGIGAYTYQVAHGLTEIGHQVEVIALTAKAEGQVAQPEEPESPSVQEGITVHRAQWNNNLNQHGTILTSTPYTHFVLKTNLALWQKFTQVHKQNPFDVVEAPEHLCEGLMPAMLKSAPLVIKLHTPHSKLLSEGFHNFKPNFDLQFIGLLERIAMLESDVLISPSQNLLEYVARDMNYPGDRIQIVRNPVDANKFTPDGDKALPASSKLTVLFAGRLEGRKGPQLLIEAVPHVVQAFPNVRFVLIGADTNTAQGKKSMLAELKNTLRKQGLTDAVTFIPAVALSQMPSYYRSADICIAPSLYDNAPYTCLEAMSTGKAFIGTTAGGMSEYVVHGESGLIVPAGDTRAIAQALISLLGDDSKRLSMGQAARTRVLEHFHRTRIAEQNIHIYTRAFRQFEQKATISRYRKGEERFLAATSDFLYSYQQMLYQFILERSFRFRLSHWARVSKNRPRLVAGIVALNLARKILKPDSKHWKVVERLENEIKQKEAQRDQLLRKQLGCSIFGR